MANYSEDTCYKCKAKFADDDDVVYCPSCKKYYHEACWIENGGCADDSCVQNPNAIASKPEAVEDELTQETEAEPKGARVASVAGSRMPKAEKVLHKTTALDSARKMFKIALLGIIWFFIMGTIFMAVGIAEDDSFAILGAMGYLFFLTSIALTILYYYKATGVTITNKRIIFETPLGKKTTIMLDLVTATQVISFFHQFAVAAPHAKGKVMFHSDNQKYYDILIEASIDRQSNII